MAKHQRICVIGLGQFGRHLAIELAKDCEVLAIDKNQSVINEIGDLVQRAYCLDSRDFASLSTVVGDDFDDAVVSMSENMEASILTVLHLRRLKLPHIHAKATSRDHAEILKAIGADSIIFPERETASRPSWSTPTSWISFRFRKTIWSCKLPHLNGPWARLCYNWTCVNVSISLSSPSRSMCRNGPPFYQAPIS